MRRLWFGVGLLTALLLLCLWVTKSTEDAQAAISSLLEQASSTAYAGDLSGGVALSQQAYARWVRCRNQIACVADHTPIEEADCLFEELFVFGNTEELPHFISCCRQLRQLLISIGDAHSLTYWNFI